MHNVDRRSFLGAAGLGASLALAGPVARLAQASDTEVAMPPMPSLGKKYRAAAIGSTGHGDFGHGLDVSLVDLSGIEFVAIADDNPKGLEEAGKRCGIDKRYGDYRKMLEAEQIDVVTIGMRHSELHEDVVKHCAAAGKHIYCEKPLATDLASFDRMAAACQEGQVKLAVALTNRASPALAQAVKLVRDGRLGQVRSLKAQGKCDHRGGGEDLMVLGYHNLDMMCLFGGQPQWTFAQVLAGDRDATKEDARPATEPIGPVAGDNVSAVFGFPGGVHGYFESARLAKPDGDRFNFEIHGTEGVITARSLNDVMWFRGRSFNPARPHKWVPITVEGWSEIPQKDHWCHRRLILDLLAAVEADREPLTGFANSRWTQEMIQSIYVSHFANGRVPLPLTGDQREHPLST